ncbi:serine hydrolase [Paenibacillus sp. PCH8]|uniref:serine hydrolase domain-containing protein n=1 Tax=Paenibacillus sp. PCH8 TaxID=2066524 RepID=UPI000CF8F7D1|nr:serine hydrolase [Paenibacillus sp. PCH8]PQP80178.1 serine hydrolase [Paenibacillus sp. PCH8]
MIQDHRIPRSSLAEQGVSLKGVKDFLEHIEAQRLELHGFMLIRHGHLVAEGWCKPYRPDVPHAVYSLTKSFTSMAAGFAVQEQLLTVDDVVLSFFPEISGMWLSEHAKNLTIKHLLTMTTGHAMDTTRFGTEGEFLNYRAELRIGDRTDGDAVRGFFELPIEHEPGTYFIYNSGASHVLGLIVERITGMCLADYLETRLFEPLGIPKPRWERTSSGGNTGGWGLWLRTSDIAKFGQFLLNKGVWNGAAIISQTWIEEATSCKVSSITNAGQIGVTGNEDWHQGYGYQFWQCRHETYRADGAFGQYCIVIPNQDAVVAITAGLQDMQAVLDSVWNHLLPAMHHSSPLQNALIKQKLSLGKWELGEKTRLDTAPELGTRRYHLEPNDRGVQEIALSFMDQQWHFEWKDERGTYGLFGGYEEWEQDNLLFGKKVAVKAAWLDNQLLEIYVYELDSPHHDRIRFRLDDQRLMVHYFHLNFTCIEDQFQGSRISD